MSQVGTELPVEDGIATYGRVKATISFVISCVFATCLIGGSILSFTSNNRDPNQSKLVPVGLGVLGCLILICGIAYLIFVMTNKHAAIDSALSSQRSYNRDYGYNPGINIRL